MCERNKKTGLLKNISKFIILQFALLVIYTINSGTNISKGISDFGGAILYAISFYSILFLIPSVIAAICGLRYCLGKNNGKLIACWIWGIISFFVNATFLYLLSEEIQIEDIKINIVINIIYILPVILYLIGCFKEQFKNSSIVDPE